MQRWQKPLLNEYPLFECAGASLNVRQESMTSDPLQAHWEANAPALL